MPSLLQRQIFKEIANLFVLAVGVLLTLILISRAVQMRELFLGWISASWIPFCCSAI